MEIAIKPRMFQRYRRKNGISQTTTSSAALCGLCGTLFLGVAIRVGFGFAGRGLAGRGFTGWVGLGHGFTWGSRVHVLGRVGRSE